MLSKGKKAQVTLFIIIGIIMLTAISIYVFIRTAQVPKDEEIAHVVIEVPTEFQPVNSYVENCILKTGKEGIEIIGHHGGYIDLKKWGITSNNMNPTNTNAFRFNPDDEESGIAYWHYFKSDNSCETDCECGSEKPFLLKKDGAPSIEEELEDYINENLEICLDDFKSFRRQGFVVEGLDKVKTNVDITNDDMAILVEYPLRIRRGGSDDKVEKFFVRLPLNIKRIYELASELVNSQVDYSYLDRWTMEQISGFGLGLDENRLPPTAANELSPGKNPVYWKKQKVKEDIENNILPLYTPFLTVFNSRNYADRTGTYYERATLPVASASGYSYNNIDINFNYMNWWPIYFDITGRGVRGGKIGPETASSSFFSFIGIKRYNFYYDVSYPVLVDIYDSEAFNNQGYHFYAGLEANVRNNKALNCSGPGVSLIAPPTGSMFCDVNQGCADITIETKDAKTNRALEGVTVYYSSGRESCDKGFSKIKNNMAIVEASLPQCVGTACSLNAVKEGYWTYPKRYAVRCGDYSSACINDNVLCDGENLKIELEPYRDNDIIVKKKMMVKQGQGGQWVFDNTAHDLNDKEYASIMLTKIKESADEEDFIVSSIYYGNESAIKLYPGIIPGRYELRIDLMYKMGDDEKVVFREVEECSGEELSDEKCVTVGPYEFNETMIEGGAVLNISITKDMLDSYNALTFYALSSPDIATNYDVLDIYDIEEMGKTGEYSKKYKVELKPTAS